MARGCLYASEYGDGGGGAIEFALRPFILASEGLTGHSVSVTLNSGRRGGILRWKSLKIKDIRIPQRVELPGSANLLGDRTARIAVAGSRPDPTSATDEAIGPACQRSGSYRLG